MTQGPGQNCDSASGCDCDCDENTAPSISNRPALSALAYRIGTHGSFLNAMKARLASVYASLGGVPDEAQGASPASPGPLTRDASDPAIAMLDAWAVVGDVLTFYQERIANEGFIRTATERRSMLELASLIGYVARPGVAASTYLAYSVQDLGTDASVDIPLGSKVQSMSPTGGPPQTFETSAAFTARASWSQLAPRISKVQQITPDVGQIWLKGSSTTLKPNDPLLIVSAGGTRPMLRRVASIAPDLVAKRIKVVLQPLPRVGDETAASTEKKPPAPPPSMLPLETVALIKQLLLPKASHPANPLRLPQTAAETLRPSADAAPQLLAAFNPTLKTELYDTLRNAIVAPDVDYEVHLFKVRAAPFGSNAPPRTHLARTASTDSPSVASSSGVSVTYTEWTFDPEMVEDRTRVEGSEARKTEAPDVIFLDNAYPNIVPQSWIVIERGGDSAGTRPVISPIAAVSAISRAQYGITGNTTRIELARGKWIDPAGDTFASVIRGTVVHAQSEKLELAEAPIDGPIAGQRIELDTVCDGLQPGRWLIVSGERTDLPDTPGVRGTEVVMLAGADHGVPMTDPSKTPDTAASADTPEAADAASATEAANAASGAPAPTPSATTPETPAPTEPAAVPGERTRTTLNLASSGLAYEYKPDTVTVYANVIPATNGETHTEVLGSGDGRAEFRDFTLAQSPLTYVSAATPSGAASTLEVRVNGVVWREVDSFEGHGATERIYVTRTLDDASTRVSFGNGTTGARLPAGTENVKAIYRTGIGTPGNAEAGQISLLATRPLGVKDVTNPVAATGGADRETADDIRRNAGHGLASLDRLVSVSDYEDFARHFAGIGKASATQLNAGTRRLVHVTVAGTGAGSIDANSPLLGNLLAALFAFGDPHLPVRVDAARPLLLVISANVKLNDDARWETVAPAIRAALADAFGFARAELGRNVTLSHVISVMQRVDGVRYVDVDVLDCVGADTLFDDLRRISGGVPARPRQSIPAGFATTARTANGTPSIQPAELAFLDPGVPGTLTLTEIST